jgi:hypothetical protein
VLGLMQKLAAPDAVPSFQEDEGAGSAGRRQA